MNGKGSRRRIKQVGKKEFEDRWAKAFDKDNKNVRTTGSDV